MTYTPTGSIGATIEFIQIVSDDADEGVYDFAIVGEATNISPTADAGADQTVASGAAVTLAGQAFSDDSNGDAETRQPVTATWAQIGGPTVSLSPDAPITANGAATNSPTFTAPTLAAGAADVVLTFQLTASDGVTTATDEITITVKAPDFSPEIEVSGNGVGIASSDTSPEGADHTDFGAAYVLGGQQLRSFTIRNSGNVALEITAITLSDTEHFALSNVPATIEADATAVFIVTYTPRSVGDHVATVTIASNDADEGNFTFAVAGTGTNELPQIAVGPDQSVLQGDSVTISGSGAVDLAEGRNEALQQMTLSWEQVSPPAPVLPLSVSTATGAASATITADFTAPTVAQTTDFVFRLRGEDGVASVTDTLTVTVDASVPIFRVLGNGQVITSGDTTPDSADHTDFGTTVAGLTQSRSFVIHNDSGAPLMVSGVGISGPSAKDISVVSDGLTMIAGGGQSAFTVNWTPSGAGAGSAIVAIQGGSGVLHSFAIALNATNEAPAADAGPD
ncbi:MAG: choice-of-anchor D domain-containing protein, partial [Paracoccaceae bacterium]